MPTYWHVFFGQRPRWITLPLIAITALLAGCGSNPSASPPSSSTSTTSSPTSTTTVTERAVLAAYRAEWAAYEQAARTANPLDHKLPATMVNPLLHLVEGNLVTYNEEGIVGTGNIELRPRVASFTRTTAVVVDCSFSNAFLIYKKTGKQVPPISKAESVGVKARLVSVGGTWKVKSQNLTEGSCPTGY